MARKSKPWFEIKKKRRVCPLIHCRFRNAKGKCLFYFEYKDGTATCANSKELSTYQKALKLKEN